MPQTSVSTTPAIGYAGQVADISDAEFDTFVNSEASAEIPFGVMVCKGTGDKDALNLHTSAAAMAADIMVGIVAHSHSYAKDNELGSTGLKPDVSMRVLRRGRILVQVEEAVTPASPVKVRAVVSGSEVAGAFRDTADSTDCVDISSFARYLSTAAAAGLAWLEIDMHARNTAVADT